MSDIVVVYELDKPVAIRSSPGTPRDKERPVRRVHAAPTAPGTPTTTGPRTLCGKDTFVMETARRRPSEHPGEPWYPAEYTAVVCPDCDAVMEI